MNKHWHKMEEVNKTNKKNKVSQEETSTMINPLTAETVQVKFIPKKGGPMGDDPRHVLAGGKADGTVNTYCLPILASTGNYKNPLTNAEKNFLEDVLDLEPNALSVYGKFWDTYYVEVPKEGMVLNLSNAEDYLKYKVLLANNDVIAPSVEAMQDRPKSTYQFVLIRKGEESAMENARMSATMESYKEFGKLDAVNDIDTMRIIVELIDAKPYSVKASKAELSSRINQLIQADPKAFLRVAKDELLHTKVLIRRATELGKISKRADFYYLKSDGSPLCNPGEDPTLSIAARWLNQPSHFDMKAILESEVEKARSEQ